MSTPKKFLIYAIILVAFFFFSNFIISVGLNSSYKKMNAPSTELPEGVEITEAESTLVNGKIKGNIDTKENEDLIGKYLKLDFYSKRDNLMGTKYIPITNVNEDGKIPFSTYFELKDVTSYKASIVAEKIGQEIKLIPEEMKKPEIILATIVTLLIFWG